MIDTLLIANRGEIARRVMRTCREMGIRTITVYSDADARQPWVHEADLAIRLGAPPPQESYLNGELILAIAQGNRVDAIHPGYGFLAENAAFAAACTGRGILFVGAPAQAIADMADKARAKMLMEAAGVPVVPGYMGEDQSLSALQEHAEGVGYPLMVKAVAGGGGRGIRIVHRSADFTDAVTAARREAESAFGDGRLMLEKYLAATRHVEFQVVADNHGNTLHFFDRECSVQRRHQKIIEEAPSPALDDELREAMGLAAVRAAQAVDYRGAGTVEFLLDEGRKFYFLEMNTRIQVEHPITEMISGVDLVRLQIEVAEGKILPYSQDELKPHGHAFECRLNAEQPQKNFLPAVGRLLQMDFPAGPGLRVDSGFEAGSEIGPHYDSLLAKLIAWGPTRDEALRKAKDLLARGFVAGLPTNLGFLQAVLAHPSFASGHYTTRLLEDAGDELLAPPEVLQDPTELILATAVVDARREMERHGQAEPFGSQWADTTGSPWTDTAGSPWTNNGNGSDWFVAPGLQTSLQRSYTWADQTHEVEIRPRPDGGMTVIIAGVAHAIAFEDQGGGRGILDFSELRLPIRWATRGSEIWISLRGVQACVTATGPVGAATTLSLEEGLLRLAAPLPGKVIQTAVTAGAEVAEGDLLLVLEAMKVEHRISAPIAGRVTHLHFAEGDPVNKDDILVELEEIDAPG